MPYKVNADLPKNISDHLPSKAQTIFREAFNNAWIQYDGDEAIAFKVAWSAVKKSYQKGEDGFWIPLTNR